MTESVTEILVARAARREPMTPMVVVSLVAHVTVFGALALISARAETAPPPNVFVISLPAGAGVDTGGANAMGGRRVDNVAPPEPVKAIETPPPLPPKMTLPEPKAKPEPKPARAKKVEEAVVKAPPATGDTVRAGSTQVDTGARGTGFGLSNGGGGVGQSHQLENVSNFCCPQYIDIVVARIKELWSDDQGRLGTAIIRFTIRRDGSVNGASVHQSSGINPLDYEALRAVQRVRLPPLPAQFPEEALTMRLTFNYE